MNAALSLNRKAAARTALRAIAAAALGAGLFLSAGCGLGGGARGPALPDGHAYTNRDLGFALALPADCANCQYFQTQRVAEEDAVRLEIYVPTAEAAAAVLVPGYARLLTVRTIPRARWDRFEAGDFDLVREGGEYVYALAYWSVPPADWQAEWERGLKDKISESFTLTGG